MRFRALREGAAPLEITLNLPGRHNVQNALAAIAVATELGVPDAVIRKALAEFRGVGRRFQRYGEIPLPPNGKSVGSFTRAARTTVLLSLVTRLPNASSTRITG